MDLYEALSSLSVEEWLATLPVADSAQEAEALQNFERDWEELTSSIS